MLDIQTFDIIKSILALVPVVFSAIIQMKGLINRRSLENIKKRYDIYEKIITNSKKKILSYTYLKEYIGFSISDDLINYIINSTKFYDIVTVLKDIYPYIDYDKKNEKIIYKNNRKPKRILYLIFYGVFSSPLILFMMFSNIITQRPEYWITDVFLSIPFILVAIFCLMKIGDRTLAIRLMEKIEKE
jgi:hypothetical protein